METYLGLDFGGTKLLIGEVDGNGRILREKRYPTGCREEHHAVDVLLSSVRDYIDTVGFQGQLQGAGLGIVGTVDYKRGRWITMHPKVTTEPIPIADLLKEELKVPVWVDNDVKSATTAELVFGSGRGIENFIYLNIGTGLSAGFVIDGRILRGRNNDSGEIGHTVVDMTYQNSFYQTPCICTRKGCVENLVSGYGFTTQSKHYGLGDAYFHNGGMADVSLLYEKALEGEAIPLKIVDYAAENMACIIMNLVKTLDPEMFILGGGCVRDGMLLEKINQKLNLSIMETVTGGLVLSKLDPAYTGVLGAAALVINGG